MITIMALEATIDGAGRLVIPKPLRDRLRLTAGTRVSIDEVDGKLVLSLDRPEAELVERDGFLVLDLHQDEAVSVDPSGGRDGRLRDLVEYALRR
jgi:AbrB family looped-hinge helix DNA binding protein